MLFISLLLAAIPLAWASPPFLHHNNGPINLSPRAAPVPTLPGIPDNCPLYHKVVEGDICVCDSMPSDRHENDKLIGP